MKKIALALTCAAIFGGAQWTDGAQLPPVPKAGRVGDYANVLSPSGRDTLQNISMDLDRVTGAELGVATVASLDGADIADYGNRLFRAWGVGKKGRNNGVLILVCPSERKSRIEVGYGLEAVLPDIVTGRILKDEMRPSFQQGRFEEGIVKGAREIAAIVSGPKAAAPPVAPRRKPLPLIGQLLMLGLPVFFASWMFGSAFSPGIKNRASCIFAAVCLVLPLSLAFMTIAISAWVIFLVVSGAVAIFFVGKRFPIKQSGGSGSSDGSSGSDSGTSSSDSGDSGFGGGDSGGGGASDSW